MPHLTNRQPKKKKYIPLLCCAGEDLELIREDEEGENGNDDNDSTTNTNNNEMDKARTFPSEPLRDEESNANDHPKKEKRKRFHLIVLFSILLCVAVVVLVIAVAVVSSKNNNNNQNNRSKSSNESLEGSGQGSGQETTSPTSSPTLEPTLAPTQSSPTGSPSPTTEKICGYPRTALLDSGESLSCNRNGRNCDSITSGDFEATMDPVKGNLHVMRVSTNELHCTTHAFSGTERWFFEYGYGDSAYATTTMRQGGSLATFKRTSPNDSRFQFSQEIDGTEIFYKSSWNSDTLGNQGAVAILQTDGRIAIVQPNDNCNVVDYVDCSLPKIKKMNYRWLFNNGPENHPYSLEIHTPELEAMFSTIVKIPDWVPTAERVHPEAQYYLYSGQHHNKVEIYLSWARSLDGMNVNTWIDSDIRPLNFNTDTSRAGGWTHISSPEIFLDHEHEIFVMSFHGESENHAFFGDRHAQWLATSPYGLNFNDVDRGGGYTASNRFDGEPYGIVEFPGFKRNDDATARFGNSYCRLFQLRERLYCFTKRGEFFRAPLDDPDTPGYEPYMALTVSNQQWEEYPDLFGGVHPDPYLPESVYDDMSMYSRISTFFGSTEFATHPNNPHPGNVMANTAGSDETRINRIAIDPIPNAEEGLYDVIFYAKSNQELFKDLYRFVLDCRSADWRDWDIFRDEDGIAVFQVLVAESHDILDGYYPGDPFIFNDNGNRYLLFSYGPSVEGWLTAVTLEYV